MAEKGSSSYKSTIAALERENRYLLLQYDAVVESQKELERRANWLEDCILERPKPVWERLLIGRRGTPRKLVSKLLFHTSGKPRGIFRKYVLDANGHPRIMFFEWMSGESYEERPAAVQLPGARYSSANAQPVSRRAKDIMKCLLSSKTTEMDQT